MSTKTADPEPQARRPPSGEPAPNKRMPAAERRTRILEAATKVFAERGYGAASMSEIARRAGVVPSVIYDHFPSKRELHVELLVMHGQALMDRTIHWIEDATPRELLHASLDAYFQFVEEDPFAWRFLFRDPPGDPVIASAWREIQDRATAGIAGLILLVAPDVETWGGVEVEQAAWILAKGQQSAVNGIAAWWYEHRDFPREQVVEITTALVWEGFGQLLERTRSA